jgi:hypothetical protein
MLAIGMIDMVPLVDQYGCQDHGAPAPADGDEGEGEGPEPSRLTSTERTAAWRARKAAASSLKRAAAEAALAANLGPEGYASLLAKRQACKDRVARHRHSQAGLGEDA